MKKKHKTKKVCIRIVMLFVLQIAFLFILRTSYINSAPPLSPRRVIPAHKVLNPPQLRSLPSLQPMSLLIQSDESKLQLKRSSLPQTQNLLIAPEPSKPAISCNRSHPFYDWCHLQNPTILDPKTATFFTRGPSTKRSPTIEKVRPYPRKRDKGTMSNITRVTLTTASLDASCQVHHDAPALVFSIGGFTGNFFHDFNDGFVPLFITIHTLFPNQHVTLVITDYSDWWYGKYEAILPLFSKHKIINLDNQTVTHCFPSVAVGLITHGPMTINPALIAGKKTFLDFRSLLEEGYRQCLVWPPPKIKGRPRLVLVSRTGPVGRVILNQDDIIRTAQNEGFDVVVFEPSAFTYLCDVYRLINGSHALVGVHGAALTHSLFLQPGAAFIQVVPLGGEWLARTYFKNLARGMRLEYTEYRLKVEESTLTEKYGMDHILVKDPNSIASKNWSTLYNIYLRGQDVRLDIVRFKGYLKIAYAKAKKLMEKQGLHVRRRPKIKRYIKPPVFSYTYGSS